jgi:hypothetical protein
MFPFWNADHARIRFCLEAQRGENFFGTSTRPAPEGCRGFILFRVKPPVAAPLPLESNLLDLPEGGAERGEGGFCGLYFTEAHVTAVLPAHATILRADAATCRAPHFFAERDVLLPHAGQFRPQIVDLAHSASPFWGLPWPQ